MWDVALDALIDTLKLFPFLFLLYILIELMEHKTKVGKPSKALSGRWAPAIGTATGILPMCGFSVMAAKLYEHRHVTIGTLIAVFTATSDEGLLVLLLSDGGMGWEQRIFSLLAMVGCKLVLGLAAGYALDALIKRRVAPMPEHAHIHTATHEEHEGHTHVRDEAHEEHEGHTHAQGEVHEDHDHGDCACDELSACEHKKEGKVRLYLLSPLLHALEVAAFVLAVNLAFGYLFYALGEENVIAFLQGTGYWLQPLICPVIGAIPNCASSVVLAEVYTLGGIGFGGLLAGLTVNAGLGYLVLFRRGSWKRGLAIFLGMLAFSVAIGYAARAVALAI